MPPDETAVNAFIDQVEDVIVPQIKDERFPSSLKLVRRFEAAKNAWRSREGAADGVE